MRKELSTVTGWQHSGIMSALLAVAQVIVVGWLVALLAFAALFAAIFVRRSLVRQAAQVQPATSEPAQPLPLETPIETPNGGAYTVAEYQALRALYTAQQWETFEVMAAQYAALHAPMETGG